MSIRLTQLTAEQFDHYFAFCQEIFPHRHHIARRFQRQVLDNPWLESQEAPNVILAVSDLGEIAGQYGLNPCRFQVRGEVVTGYSGFDYYTREAYRKQGVGIRLAAAALRKQPYFGIGATPLAEQIYQTMGATTIGHMVRYLWLRTPLPLLFLLGERVLGQRWPRDPQGIGSWAKLPGRLEKDGITFQRASQATGDEDQPWSPTVLSFSRTSAYLQWRYYDDPDRYVVYRHASVAGSAYFALRRFHWRGLALLAMVDFRVPVGAHDLVRTMVQAAKELARVAGFDGVVAFSSLAEVDDSLQASGYRRVGQPTIIVAKGLPIEMEETRIAGRDFLLCTWADCDQDFAIYD